MLEILPNALLSDWFLKEFLETRDLCSENFLKIWKTKSWELQLALTKEVFVFILSHNKFKSAYIFQITTKYLEKPRIL